MWVLIFFWLHLTFFKSICFLQLHPEGSCVVFFILFYLGLIDLVYMGLYFSSLFGKCLAIMTLNIFFLFFSSFSSLPNIPITRMLSRIRFPRIHWGSVIFFFFFRILQCFNRNYNSCLPIHWTHFATYLICCYSYLAYFYFMIFSFLGIWFGFLFHAFHCFFYKPVCAFFFLPTEIFGWYLQPLV